MVGTANSAASIISINGTYYGSLLTVNATTVYFGSSSIVSTDGMLSAAAGIGGSNSIGNDKYAGGGGHGGSGGSPEAGKGGRAYDSYIFPSMAGGAGGRTNYYSSKFVYVHIYLLILEM